MMARVQEEQNNLNRLKQQAEQLKTPSAGAKGGRRAQLTRQLAIVQSQIELSQSRLESYNALVQFETTEVSVGNQGTGLSGQIDALERGVPQLNAPAKGAAAVSQAAPPVAAATARPADQSLPASDNGLLGTIETLIGLERERSTLADRINETLQLAAAIDAARAPLIARLRELNASADAMAAQPGGDDLAASRARKQQFDNLIKRHKAITDALVPLTKQGVVLQLYVANLRQWSGAVDQRSANQLRRLIIRLSALGVLLLAIFIAAVVWRNLTFRYVKDFRRRRQLLQLRKVTLALVVGLVLLFDFSSQLGTLATVMGLAAAGVALALQNVILSFAGYFFVTGRYGIRVGDRIQIAGISGDVIDIGLFKLALMELVGDGVKVVGEDELVGASGQRASSGHANRASQGFTKDFTKVYSQLAERSPVYAELRNMIDLAVMAAYMQQHDFYSKANWKADVLGDESTIATEIYNAPTQVATVVNVIRKSNQVSMPNGGVDINPLMALKPEKVMADKENKVSAARDKAKIELPKGRWWWD